MTPFNGLNSLIIKWKNADKNYKNFLLGSVCIGINAGILIPIFNNFLHDVHNLNAAQRGMIEFPREAPGFLLIFITAILSSYSLRSWSILVGLFSSIGILGLGFFSPNIATLVLWMFLWSVGEHLYMPIESTIGLALSKKNHEGRRLGQIAGAKHLAMIIGTVLVWSSFEIFNLSYTPLFIIGASIGLISTLFFKNVNISKEVIGENKKFVFRKEYSLFYFLNVIFGARKQIFLTFAPWLLINQFQTPTQTMALLIFIASILGFFFRQVFGELTDYFGEKKMLVMDALLFLLIALGFALLKNVTILFALYILDNLMFATRIARTTYLKKIALKKEDIATTISFGISIDHLVSMTIPILGGMLWAYSGYQAVFFVAAVLSIINIAAAFYVKTNLIHKEEV